ncbi:hypothetical protein ACIBUR_18410 [Streptomyces anulatus]
MTDLTGKGVSLARERTLAGEHWLLGAASSVRAARADWVENGTTFLRPGALFGAVLFRAAVVHAALLLEGPVKCADPLRTRLGGGPVFYAEHEFGREAGYVALVPAAVARVWGVHGSVAHHRKALLQVPAPGNVRPDQGAAWWAVPPGRPWSAVRPAAARHLDQPRSRRPQQQPGRRSWRLSRCFAWPHPWCRHPQRPADFGPEGSERSS